MAYLAQDYEKAYFALVKYTTAKPFAASGAWNLLGLVQMGRGLHHAAEKSFYHALELISIEQEEKAEHRRYPIAGQSLWFSAPDADSLPEPLASVTKEEKVRIVRLNRARNLNHIGKYSDAISEFKELLEDRKKRKVSEGELAEVELDVASSCYYKGDYEESMNFFQAVVDRTVVRAKGSKGDAELGKGVLLLLAQAAFYGGKIEVAKRSIMQWYVILSLSFLCILTSPPPHNLV